MSKSKALLLSGNEAVALAACDAGVTLGTGYPGTPSTEILENFSSRGGKAQWAPNEKVALEVGIGAAFGGGRVLVTMKHVGVNVAADPLFTGVYTGVAGSLVLISADDPSMHSSQNEQDNRNYSRAAAIPTVEPSTSQEAYDFLFEAFKISDQFNIPVMMRMTTRICHSKGVVRVRRDALPPVDLKFERDIPSRLMVPGHARMAHRRLRQTIEEIREWNETSPLNECIEGGAELGIIANGVSFLHAREAAPEASVFKVGMCYPLPLKALRAFADRVDRCVVIEEGDHYLVECLRTAGIEVECKDEMYRFGEMNVDRVLRILNKDSSPEEKAPPGKPPRLCSDCPHRMVFGALRNKAIVAGDIGCYTLGGLKPLNAMDTCVCMGASIGVGLGLRHVLPDEEAKRVVSVIGDSTFVHSGITGLVEMVYNRPKTGHVVIIVDNGTTAMTGMQEHPGTGRKLDHTTAGKIDFEGLAKSIGIEQVHVLDPVEDPARFNKLLDDSMASEELVLIISRRLCALAAPKLEAYKRAQEACNE